MYTPPHFEEARPEVLARIVRDYPLGVLVTHGAAGLDANHLPFLLDATQGAQGVLQCHVARANPVWRAVADGAEVLVVFRGAEGYVSPNWYPSKAETHRQVPTWNYEVVHAHGRLRVHDDAKWVRALVGRLTRQHEATQPRPWKMGDAPADYLDSMVAAVVGLEVEVRRWEAKSKLSQNKEARDRAGVVEALQGQGAQALVAAMREVGS